MFMRLYLFRVHMLIFIRCLRHGAWLSELEISVACHNALVKPVIPRHQSCYKHVGIVTSPSFVLASHFLKKSRGRCQSAQRHQTIYFTANSTRMDNGHIFSIACTGPQAITLDTKVLNSWHRAVSVVYKTLAA